MANVSLRLLYYYALCERRNDRYSSPPRVRPLHLESRRMVVWIIRKHTEKSAVHTNTIVSEHVFVSLRWKKAIVDFAPMKQAFKRVDGSFYGFSSIMVSHSDRGIFHLMDRKRHITWQTMSSR